MAAASGFQWQQRQLFWGSVQCPASEDLAVQAMGSVLGSCRDDFTGTALQDMITILEARFSRMKEHSSLAS
ncbi:hypothetical protein R6Z07F_005741 [Ovis aries]